MVKDNHFGPNFSLDEKLSGPKCLEAVVRLVGARALGRFILCLRLVVVWWFLTGVR